eukprot:PhF_6_TR44015/c0_g1_i2/m.67220
MSSNSSDDSGDDDVVVIYDAPTDLPTGTSLLTGKVVRAKPRVNIDISSSSSVEGLKPRATTTALHGNNHNDDDDDEDDEDDDDSDRESRTSTVNTATSAAVSMRSIPMRKVNPAKPNKRDVLEWEDRLLDFGPIEENEA